MTSARSYLFVPGDRPDMLAKVLSRDADAVIADLEDAVVYPRKTEARQHVVSWLDHVAGVDGGPDIWVRVNNHPGLLADDLAAVGDASALTGVVVSKLDSMETLDEVDRSLPPGVAVIGLIESGGGLVRVADLAAGPRIQRLGMGEADLCSELGIAPSPGEMELLPYRMTVVAASAAAGIGPPIGPVSTEFGDVAATRESTLRLRRMGFGARFAIHPAQVSPINEAFTPSAEEVARAERIVAGAGRAAESGAGVFVDENGRMVDEAVVKGARQVLDRAGKPGSNR